MNGSGERKQDERKREEEWFAFEAVTTDDGDIKQGRICWLQSLRLGYKFKIPVQALGELEPDEVICGRQHGWKGLLREHFSSHILATQA